MKEALINEIVLKLSEIGINAQESDITDIEVSKEFLDAKWNTGEKKITFSLYAYFDEENSTIYYYELTKELSKGFSFGSDTESSFQIGNTVYRKLKSVGYSPEGKEYEYEINLGDVISIFKETAKKYNWKFKLVINKKKAMYSSTKKVKENSINENSIVDTPKADEKETIDVKEIKKDVSSKVSNKIKPTIFWIWFCILILSLVIFLAAAGTILSGIICIASLGLLIFTRNKIFKNLFVYVITLILVPTILFTTIVLLSPENTNKTNNMFTSDSIVIKSATFSNKIENKTFKPLNETKSFKTNEKINYVLYFDKIPQDTIIKYSWYYNNEVFLNDQYTLDNNLKNQYLNITFNFEDTTSLLPTGDYKVIVTGIIDSKEIFKVNDTCKVEK